MMFEPYPLADLDLGNRVVMAPMTRCRAAQPGNVPTPLMAEYYRQRAGAGLIVAEGTLVSEPARGYLWTPGINTPEQVEGWRDTTRAVHQAGGRIFVQLWHCGRVSHTSVQPNGRPPVSSVAVAAQAETFALDGAGNPGRVPCSEPHALAPFEIKEVVDEFRLAAQNAEAAGFDGVELHGANGYLLEQFLNGALNRREDDYGGSIENRARLLLMVVDEAIAVLGAGRVGVRLSPHNLMNDMPPDPDADAMALYLARELGERGIAYLHLVDPKLHGYAEAETLLKSVRERFGGTTIVCGNLTRESGEAYLAEGVADLIGFGRPFIANPDLPARLRAGVPLVEPDPATFYGGGEQGYTDYPAL